MTGQGDEVLVPCQPATTVGVLPAPINSATRRGTVAFCSRRADARYFPTRRWARVNGGCDGRSGD
jgi:hypothetical protein